MRKTMTGPYACAACGASFATEAELKQHGAMHQSAPSSAESPPSFACKACGASFGSETELKAHGAQAHRM